MSETATIYLTLYDETPLDVLPSSLPYCKDKDFPIQNTSRLNEIDPDIFSPSSPKMEPVTQYYAKNPDDIATIIAELTNLNKQEIKDSLKKGDTYEIVYKDGELKSVQKELSTETKIQIYESLKECEDRHFVYFANALNSLDRTVFCFGDTDWSRAVKAVKELSTALKEPNPEISKRLEDEYPLLKKEQLIKTHIIKVLESVDLFDNHDIKDAISKVFYGSEMGERVGTRIINMLEQLEYKDDIYEIIKGMPFADILPLHLKNKMCVDGITEDYLNDNPVQKQKYIENFQEYKRNQRDFWAIDAITAAESIIINGLFKNTPVLDSPTKDCIQHR